MLGTLELTHETIVQEISDAITRQQAVQTLSVGRNATVEGKTGDYQADIFWEFTDGAITYKTVIQVKDWDKTAGNSELFRFLSMLRDIPGHTSGVFFTQPVYHKELKSLAQDAGIVLYEVRVHQAGNYPVVTDVRINVDEEWAKAEKQRVGMEGQTVQLTGDSRNLFIYNAQGQCRDSVSNLFDRYAGKYQAGREGKETVIHEFAEPGYLQTDNDLFPFVKLNSISFNLEIQVVPVLNGDEAVETILQGILQHYNRR